MENKTFLGVDGVIGRRDFFVNYLIVLTIKLFIYSILAYVVFFNTNIMTNLIEGNKVRLVLGMKAMLGVYFSSLLYPSIVRRVRDIFDFSDENKVKMVSLFMTVLLFSQYTPAGDLFLVNFISTFTLFMLFFWQGKITGEKPQNEVIQFNWGACLGTWIWGIINKLPITFLAIPLLFTFGIFPFMLICGLKGNEWLYNKQKEVELDKFYKKQAVQGVTMFILSPVINLLLFMFLTTLIVNGFTSIYGKVNFLNIVSEKTKIYQTIAARANFSNIEKVGNEYKFYMDPRVWEGLPYRFKKTVFTAALGYVQNQEYPDKNIVEIKELEQIEDMKKIKIYSSYNNELLAKFEINLDEYSILQKEEKSFENMKKMMEMINNGYEFNDSPASP